MGQSSTGNQPGGLQFSKARSFSIPDCPLPMLVHSSFTPEGLLVLLSKPAPRFASP